MFKKRKGLSILLALVMVFALSTNVFAAAPGYDSIKADPPAGSYIHGNDGDHVVPYPTNMDGSTYVINEIDTGARSISVSVVIEAGDRNVSGGSGSAFRVEIPSIQVQTNGGYVTVSRVIDALNQASAIYGLTFYGRSGTSLEPFTPTTSYLAAVEHSGTTWQAGQVADYMEGQFGFDGWSFRVNNMFPVQPLAGYGAPYYEGTGITQTYVDNGDVIHLFYDLPTDYSLFSGPNFAADFIRAVRTGSTSSMLTVQLQGHKTNIDSSFLMFCYDYAALGSGIAATLWDKTGTTLLDIGSTNASGLVTFSHSFASGQTYIVKTTSTYHPGHSGAGLPIYNNTFFARTGAYSKILIP